MSPRRGNPAYVKGKSGNPRGVNGSPAFDPKIRQFKETAYRDFIDALQLYGFMTPAELEAELQNPKISNFNLMFGNLVRSASAGDKDARQLLIDRLWGRVAADPAMQINFSAIPTDKLYELAGKALRTLQIQRPEVLDESLVRMLNEKVAGDPTPDKAD